MTSATDDPGPGDTTTAVLRDTDRARALTMLRESAALGRVSPDTFQRRVGVLMTAEKPEEITSLLRDLPFREKSGRMVRAVGRLSAFQRSVRHAWEAERYPELVLPAPGRYPMSIGRAPGSVLRISDATVSRFHAQLTATGDGWTLRDIGSANGTWVNGARLLTVVPVRSGDLVRFGAVTYRLTSS